MLNALRSYGSKVVGGTSLMVAGLGSALAATDPQFVTDAVAAIDAAKAQGLTVGGAVIVAVAGLVAIGIILSMVRKA